MNYFFTSFLLFLAALSASFAQQLISLNTFKGNNVQTNLTVDAPYHLYVSASSDDDALLNNIFLYSGATKISLFELKTSIMAQSFGQLKPFLVQNYAYLQTTLTDDQMAQLTGVIFLSSTYQVTKSNFYVFDVKPTDTINLNMNQLGTIQVTMLFLNTYTQFNPVRSSLFTDWKQNSGSRVTIYRGIPYGNMEPAGTEIFANPMHTRSSRHFFDNMEPFSLSMVAFYMKTFNGAPNFKIRTGQTNLAGAFTTAFTTTGFYMKPMGQVDAVTQFNLKKDDSRTGRTGANIIGTLPNGGKVNFDVYKGSEDYNESIVPTNCFQFWSTPNIGNSVAISSTGGTNGVYYVQYFVAQDDLTSTALPTTSPYPQTTTSGVKHWSSGVSMVTLMIVCGFFIN